MGVLAILFFTNPNIDKKNLDKIFLQGRVKWHSERHCRCQNKFRTPSDEIATIMQRKRMIDTGAYDTVNSTNSCIDDPYTHVIEYRSYWL